MEISRRELLVAITYISGLGALAVYVWDELEAYKGYVTEKRIILHNTDQFSQILTIDEGNNISTHHDKFGLLANSSNGNVTDSDMGKLEEKHQNVEFKVVVDVYNDDNSKEQMAYAISREQFNRVDPGDYISFQISISENKDIVSFSCIAPNQSSLQSSCEYEDENETFSIQSRTRHS